MDAASFLSAVVDIALAVAGFAGIVAAVRQRQLAHWQTEQLLQLQILFTASAAAIVLALLPSFLAELGFNLGLEPYILPGGFVVGALTVASGAAYMLQWVRHMANGNGHP